MAYKNALRHYSMYFKGQLSGAWPEAEAGVLEFTDVEPEIMQRVVYFITTRQYERPASVDDQFGTISELWVLADWLGIPLLGNLMINELRDAVVDSWTAPVEQINYIYDNTAPGSSLRRAAVFYTCRILGLPSSYPLPRGGDDADCPQTMTWQTGQSSTAGSKKPRWTCSKSRSGGLRRTSRDRARRRGC